MITFLCTTGPAILALLAAMTCEEKRLNSTAHIERVESIVTERNRIEHGDR